MYKAKKETSKGLKVLLIISFVFLALFFISFVVFALVSGQSHDPDLKDFGAVLQYHVSGFGGLFSFNFHEASNIAYFGLSCLLYSLIVLWLVFLIVGIIVGKKNKRPVIIFGIVLTLLWVSVYLFSATGTPKYWLIINRRSPFEDNVGLLISTFAILVFATLYALASFISYFACVLEVYKNPKVEANEEKEESEEESTPEQAEESSSTEEPVLFEAFETEPEPEEATCSFYEEPKEERFEEEPPMEEEIEEHLDKDSLANLIRNIVREEMSHHMPEQPYPGHGPLVVQYFGTMPTKQQVNEPKQEEPKNNEDDLNKSEEPAPAAEAVKSEATETVVEEVKPEPVKEKSASSEPLEKNKIIRIPFQERMLNADEEMKRNYNELKNEILSYGVNSRVSNSGDAFRLHCKTYVKITIAGLSLKLYFALDPNDYKDSPLPVQDAGHKGIYAEIPLVFKVKSGLSMRRAKELIQTVMEKDELEQGPVTDIDWVEKLKDAPEEPIEDKED